MKRNILIAVDVDGTLRCNCKPECIDPGIIRGTTMTVADFVNALSTFKNVRLMVWSGGGKDYAQNAINRYGILRAFPASKIDPTTWVYGKPNIAIDDIQSFNMADFNLIVREK